MDEQRITRRKVYDPVLRILHAWNGLTIVLIWATAQFAESLEKGAGRTTVWEFHVLLGYGLAAGLVSRLVWGFIGPKNARWTGLWHPAAWRDALFRRRFPAQSGFGHHPLASGVYLTLYVVLFGMAISGIGLAGIKFGSGPLASLYDTTELKKLFKGPHEIGSFGLVVFVVLHFAAMIWHERKEGVPIAQSMISGFQYRRVPEKKE